MAALRIRSLLVSTCLLTWGAAHAVDRPVAPDVPLPARAVADEDRPPFRFVTVHPEMSARAEKPQQIAFSIHPSMPMRISKLAGTPYGEIPIYRRIPRIEEKQVPSSRVWEIQFVANLTPKNLNGNVMFMIFDREDPTAVSRHTYVAMWEATMSPFHFVGAQLRLDPESEGFHATHTYLLRIVQRLGPREVLLAQGTFRLE